MTHDPFRGRPDYGLRLPIGTGARIAGLNVRLWLTLSKVTGAVRAFHRRFLSRRTFLAASGAAAAGSVLRPWYAQAAGITDVHLIAQPGHAHLVGAAYPETAVWAYNDKVPGPEIRVQQGERLRITVENQLAEETTVHWHGIRVPNPMDGVPYLTQPPIAPGGASR